jgi:DNA-binding NarL/FixJ family response regulator
MRSAVFHDRERPGGVVCCRSVGAGSLHGRIGCTIGETVTSGTKTPSESVGRVRVLLADDDALVRAAVKRALEEDGGFTICSELADAVSCVEAATRDRPDVCLLDVRMPPDGIAAAKEIVSRLPETRVVMLTVSDDEDDLFEALEAGVSGYILKGSQLERLGAVLHDVVDGRVVVAPELLGQIVAEFRSTAPRRRTINVQGKGETLTSREWEVLDLLRREFSTAEIADRLFISPATVRSHVAAILKKLDVPDRRAVIRLFRQHQS